VADPNEPVIRGEKNTRRDEVVVGLVSNGRLGGANVVVPLERNNQDATWWDFVKALLKKFQPEYDSDLFASLGNEEQESGVQENREDGV